MSSIVLFNYLIIYNLIGLKQMTLDCGHMPDTVFPDDFLSQKAWEGLQSSREMLPSEELILVYSTF